VTGIAHSKAAVVVTGPADCPGKLQVTGEVAPLVIGNSATGVMKKPPSEFESVPGTLK